MISNVITVNAGSQVEKCDFIRSLINEKHDGKIFSAVNVKKDGSLREYRARYRVKAHQVGGKNTTAHKANLITIYDMGQAAQIGSDNIEAGKAPYKAFNMETAIMITFKRGNVEDKYYFVDDYHNCQAIEPVLTIAGTLTSTLHNLVAKAIK